MTKPKFRLHAHSTFVKYPPYDPNAVYWSCSVLFPTPSTHVILNSGPCSKPVSAIAEAALLMRRHLGGR